MATLSVSCLALRGWRVECDRVARDAVLRCERLPPRPPLGLQSERIDDREQTAPQPALDDLIENIERIGARSQVMLPFAEQTAQRIR